MFSSVDDSTTDYVQEKNGLAVENIDLEDIGSNNSHEIDENATGIVNNDPEEVINRNETFDSTTALLPSIPESYRSVPVAEADAKWWKKLSAFIGPGVLVAVGYMDPGNWSTDIAGGSLYNYSLLFVVLLSSAIAIFLQSLAVKLGISQGRDLAQVCRDSYSYNVSFVLWIIFEVAIAATDMAEVLGSAVALKLLFGLPIAAGVCITVFDVLAILFLHRGHIRIIELLVFCLVTVICVSFIIQISYSKPPILDLLEGYLPRSQLVKDSNMLFVAISIIGATVMPHNLFLHSSLVLTRASRTDPEGMKEAIRYATIDSTICLICAFFVNSFILIVAASAFYRHGYYEIASLEDAHRLLQPVLGSEYAPYLFAIALLASGQSATFTGTFAGQIVMEGFVQIQLPPTYRRLVTRLIAIIPALIATSVGGDGMVDQLLLMSQVILSFALPFAIFPLVQFTSDKKKMGQFVNSTVAKAFAYGIFLLITALNLFLLSSS